MQSLDELTFQIELPLTPAEVLERLDAACDSFTFEGVGTGLRPLWGSVGDPWFRVRATHVSSKGPVAEGYVVPSPTGSRVTVNGELDPEGARLARDSRWVGPIGGVFALIVGLGAPGAVIPGLLVGTAFIGGAWAAHRWQVDAARRTRRVLVDVLTGAPPPPAKWRPRLPETRLGNRGRSPDTQA